MAIEKHKDPKTRQDYLLATGKVDAVYLNALKEVKTYTGGKNGPWTPTHSAVIVVDGTKIGLGLTEKESIRAKDVNDQYQDVEKGAEVSVVVEEGEEYKGVMQYNSRSSNITVIEVAPKAAVAQTEQKSFKPKDSSGVETGHAVNGALYLVRNDVVENDNDAIESAAKVVHNVTVALKKEYSEKNPKMSEYDVGAMVGHAVLNATRDVTEISDIESFARDILDNIVPGVSEYVKASKQEVAKKSTPTKETKPKPATKPISEKNAAPVQESAAEQTLTDMDEDTIPF